MIRLAKQLGKTLLGPRRARKLTRWLRREQPTFYEADLIQAVFEDRREAGVIVDVGAHHGESFQAYLEMGWKVYAFEPDPINRARLKELIPVERIRLFDCAVGDREAESVPFFASDESTGISGLSAFRDTHRNVATVRLTTLDRVLADEGVSRVDFLKIDTEGHDLFVLRGFPWERLRPDAILCEFEDYKTLPLGYDYRAMADFLVSKGYEVHLSEWEPIVRYGVNHRWRSWTRYPCEQSNSKAWGNLVAFKPGLDLAPVRKYLKRLGVPPGARS